MLSEIFETARRQHWVLTTNDAAAFHVSRKTLAAYLLRHGWVHPYPGIFVAPAAPRTFDQAAYIATLIAGRHRVLVARRAAAFLWGMTRTAPPMMELIVPVDRHDAEVSDVKLDVDGHRPLTIKVTRTRTLRMSDAEELRGIPVTAAARTVIDLAAVLSLAELRLVVIDSLQRRLLSLPDIATIHDAVKCYPGRKKVTLVLADLAEETCDSRLEYVFRKEARRRGFRPYPRPFPYRCSDGRTISIDVAFPAAWVAVEIDGLAFHSDRQSLVLDHKRQNRAVVDGWRPFRVDWTRLSHDADALFAELAALLASPHAHTAPAAPAAAIKR